MTLASGFAGCHIVLGVSGGIAAYKSVELLRLLTKMGADVRIVMTRNATRFVGPVTFEALSGRKVCMDLFNHGDDAAIGHIEWAKAADAVVIAPATANIIGKLAGGIADDALSTFMLAVTAPVLICPAMNTHMLAHPAVMHNLEMLRSFGHRVLMPGAGELACGTTGPGRLPDPADILDRLLAHLTTKDLAGKRVLVTAGPTQEAIDPVRFISNPSTGKMGYALARAAEHRGAAVTLVSGPTHLTAPLNVESVPVTSAHQMAAAVYERLERVDVVIKAAAVSDYRPTTAADQKIKKGPAEMVMTLEKNPDILATLGQRKTHQILVGFAAETQQLTDHAAEKLVQKNLDMIVANRIGPADTGFGADTNQVVLLCRDGGRETLALMPKPQLAHLILDRIVAMLAA